MFQDGNLKEEHFSYFSVISPESFFNVKLNSSGKGKLFPSCSFAEIYFAWNKIILRNSAHKPTLPSILKFSAYVQNQKFRHLLKICLKKLPFA